MLFKRRSGIYPEFLCDIGHLSKEVIDLNNIFLYS
jgi:hypothetical protein